MYLGLKIRIYPNKTQKEIIDEHIEGARYVYNYFLNYAKEKSIYDLEIWKKELQLLIEKKNKKELINCDYYLLMNQLYILKNTFDSYFKNLCLEPHFKKKTAIISAFKISNKNQNIIISNNHIYIELLGNLKAKISKDIKNNKIYSIVVKRTTNNIYEASILYDAFIPFFKKTYRRVGIDIGVRKFITTSDKEFILPPDNLKAIEDRIRRLQKLLSNKEKESNNWFKLKDKIAKLHIYRNNYIKDILNKATTKLVKEYDVIFMENISIHELVKQQEKKAVRRKIMESSLNSIREMLIYKCKMYGKKLILIDRFFPSSKICSECGFRHDPKDEETFICPVCGLTIDRDYNAAKNIYNYGMSKKQEWIIVRRLASEFACNTGTN